MNRTSKSEQLSQDLWAHFFQGRVNKPQHFSNSSNSSSVSFTCWFISRTFLSCSSNTSINRLSPLFMTNLLQHNIQIHVRLILFSVFEQYHYVWFTVIKKCLNIRKFLCQSTKFMKLFSFLKHYINFR